MALYNIIYLFICVLMYLVNYLIDLFVYLFYVYGCVHQILPQPNQNIITKDQRIPRKHGWSWNNAKLIEITNVSGILSSYLVHTLRRVRPARSRRSPSSAAQSRPAHPKCFQMGQDKWLLQLK